MNGSPALWRSSGRVADEHFAAEIRCAVSELHRLPDLMESSSHGQAVSFIFVSCDGAVELDARTIEATLNALQRLGSARLCLAGNRATLAAIADSVSDNDQVGLMLIDVDADTPLSELLWDRIEAVRFKPEFVVRAASELRYRCALEAMNSLCRELGLCTLGHAPIPATASRGERTEFDYMPAIVEERPKIRPLSPRLPGSVNERSDCHLPEASCSIFGPRQIELAVNMVDETSKRFKI